MADTASFNAEDLAMILFKTIEVLLIGSKTLAELKKYVISRQASYY